MQRSLAVRHCLGAALSLLLIGAIWAPQGAAQRYPSKPIRIINITAAGGPTDIMARSLGQRFAEMNGRNFVVENRPGANSIIAAEACAKAAPDGYTMCILPKNAISLNPYLYRSLPYDGEKSFEPVTNLVVGQQVLVLHPSIPANTFQELVEYSKQHPNTINYASAGIGSNVHVTMELMKRQTGASFTHIPFKAASEPPLAFERGDLHLMYLIIGIPGVMEQIRAGRAKPLFTSGDTRSPLLPNVPTFAEVGFAKFDARNWFGLFAPARTPKDIVGRVSADVASILGSAAYREKVLSPIGFEPIGGTPEEFARFLAEDRRRGAELVRISGVRLD